MMEELGEFADALLKEDKDDMQDALGDMQVVLINLAHLAGFNLENCLETAWNEIKDRKGSMKNNTYIKEETKEEKEHTIYLNLHKNGYYNLPAGTLKMPLVLKTTQLYFDGDSYPEEVILKAMKPSKRGGVAYVYPADLYDALVEYESLKTKQ